MKFFILYHTCIVISIQHRLNVPFFFEFFFFVYRVSNLDNAVVMLGRIWYNKTNKFKGYAYEM